MGKNLSFFFRNILEEIIEEKEIEKGNRDVPIKLTLKKDNIEFENSLPSVTNCTYLWRMFYIHYKVEQMKKKEIKLMKIYQI